MVIYEPYPTIPLKDLHDELRFEYPDLPSQLFDYYILRTAVDMAERGNLLRRRIALELEPRVTRYALRSPDDLKIWAILGVWHSGSGSLDCGVSYLSRALQPPPDACWWGNSQANRSKVWWDSLEQVLHVSMCGCSGILYITLAVVPDRKACELPQIYREEYLEALMLGTRSAIMLITGRPWTNLRLGGQLRTEYIEAVKALSVNNMTQQQRGAMRINFGRAL